MRRLLLSVVAAAVIGPVAAGCGSGSSSGSPAGSTSAGKTSTAASSSSTLDCGKVESSTTLSWNGPSASVTPPSGQKLVVLIPTSLQAEAAVRPVDGMKAALKKLGWKAQVLDGKGTPSVYNSDIQQAINLHAAAIITDGVDPALVKNSLAAARSHGIVVISDAETGDPNVSPTPPSTGYYADVSPDETAMGKAIGQEIICASNKKADVLAFNDAEYASVVKFIDAAVAEVKSCSTCKVEKVVQTNVTQLMSTIPSETVSAIRTNPSINSVLSGYDPVAVFQIPALQSAGLLNKVKLYSEYGDVQNLKFIRTGKQEATVAVPYEWSGWAAVDEMLRAMTHKPLVNENIPFALITKTANMPPAGQPFTGGVNYAAEYAKLWGLS